MTTPLRFLLLLALLSASFGFAAETSEISGVAATTNVRGADYPRILPDNRIVFRIKAEKAQSIKFHVDKTYPATRDDNGVWTAITDPQVPGFHYYWLVVDDVWLNDPASETFYGVSKQSSGVEVPEPGDAGAYHQPKDVPHGEVRERWYRSSITAAWRRIFIYTPPGYDDARDTRYPVLYLQHGGGEDERGWVVQGKMSHIMDNLIAAKQAVPMLVVMEQGYGRRPGEPEVPLRPPAGLFDKKPATPGAAPRPVPVPPDFSRMFSALEDVFVRDLIPFVDTHYRTVSDREHRAMAGLSMGGMQSFMIGLNHLDLFSYIGGFSGAGGGFAGGEIDIKTINGGVMADADAFNKKLKLIWIGLGTEEPPRIYEGVNGYHKALEAGGIKHIYWESKGTAHEWLTWRRSLHEFAPLLFH